MFNTKSIIKATVTVIHTIPLLPRALTHSSREHLNLFVRIVSLLLRNKKKPKAFYHINSVYILILC